MDLTQATGTYSNELKGIVSQQRAAVDLQHCIGKLLLDQSVELVLFRNHLVNVNTSEILCLYGYAEQVVGSPMLSFDSTELAGLLCTKLLAPAKIDLGKLVAERLNGVRSKETSIRLACTPAHVYNVRSRIRGKLNLEADTQLDRHQQRLLTLRE